jgi:hypothetical protein
MTSWILSQWFSTLDLKSGTAPRRWKTAFSTGQGLWNITVMPFGLCKARATFERQIEFILRGLIYDACLVYQVYIIVIGRTFRQHLDSLQKVFQRLGEAHLKMNQKELGTHSVSPGSDNRPGKAGRCWPQPTDKHQLRIFLGLCTYYQMFISGFAEIARTLTQLTEDKRLFHWSPEAETAYHSLKNALCTTPVLGYPQSGKKFIVDNDRAKWGLEEYFLKYRMSKNR